MCEQACVHPVTRLWCWQAEIAAKLVAKAQCLARIAKADAIGRLKLQRSTSAATASSLHRGGSEHKHLGKTASVSHNYFAHAASASKDRLVLCFVAHRVDMQLHYICSHRVRPSHSVVQAEQQGEYGPTFALLQRSSSVMSLQHSVWRVLAMHPLW